VANPDHRTWDQITNLGSLISLASKDCQHLELPIEINGDKPPVLRMTADAKSLPTTGAKWDKTTNPLNKWALDPGSSTYASKLQSFLVPAFRRCVVITSGMHGDEWPAPNALYEWCKDFLGCRADGKTRTAGGVSFTGADATDAFNKLDIYVVPVINPIGYKNNVRGNGTIDLNRNFPIMWDPKPYYAPGGFSPGSTGEGSGPLDQPETKNLALLLGMLEVSLLIDLHTGLSPQMVYPWGFETNSSANTSCGYVPGKECGKADGPLNSGYGECMPAATDARLKSLAAAMKSAAQSVPGAPTWEVGQNWEIPSNHHAVLCGAFDDFALSLDPDNGAAFTLDYTSPTLHLDDVSDALKKSLFTKDYTLYRTQIAAVLYTLIQKAAATLPSLPRPNR
jgi:hypothetical protein